MINKSEVVWFLAARLWLDKELDVWVEFSNVKVNRSHVII
jgi:hypothetical protein